MGVPKFYRWLSERYPCLSEVVKEHQIPEIDNLYLDMNGIIHVCSHPNDDDPHFRITEEKIFQDVFHYIEVLFRMIQPKKVFFMAIDGVAPRAKMNQQRGRRFRSAKEAELNEKRAKDRGEELPKEARFDSNCITPGTPFMVRLHQQLQYFVTMKISNDTLWQGVKVVLSGHETPGEGEHKIMDYIRYEKSKPDYDPNIRHCLYGLDADLIMLGLCTHDPHFSLLREEVRFGGKKTPQKRITTPEETTFHLLHLSLLREYMDHEFWALKEPGKLPFPYDLEAVIDDWILLGFLVGNDFIPHLPHLHINKGALSELFDTYKQVLPSLGGYMNCGGSLSLPRFEKFLAALAEKEMDRFEEIYSDAKWIEGKTAKRKGGQKVVTDTPGPANVEEMLLSASDAAEGWQMVPKSKGGKDADLLKLLQSADDFLTDDAVVAKESPDSTADDDVGFEVGVNGRDNVYHMEFRQHKREYYIQKLGYDSVTPEVLREQAECYVRAIQWNLHYYYNGCVSWSWYYPHHYAPWITDVKGFTDMNLTFELSTPFRPFEQLLSVLPAASKDLLPPLLQTLMINPASPIIDFYPQDFENDLNGKQQDWEAVVLIPFIDEKKLLETVEPLFGHMAAEEQARNQHGPMLVYTHTSECLGTYSAAQYFPDIERNFALKKDIWRSEFDVPVDKLRKGLMKGVRLDVFFPGFPTLKHIPHRAVLRKSAVRVFEQPSRGLNMMLLLEDQGRPDVHEVANQLIGKEIWVSWPHMVEAKVVGLLSKNHKYFMDKEGRVHDEPCDAFRQEYDLHVQAICDRYKSRWGVEVGTTHIVLNACVMTGRKYVCGAKGKITLDKQWSKIPQPFALQTTRKDILVHDPSFTQYRTLPELFPVGSTCFMIGQPNYGCQATVLKIDKEHKGRIQLSVIEPMEPNLSGVKKKQQDQREHYFPGFKAAQKLGISSHLLSRLTGSIFVIKGPREAEIEYSSKVNVGLNLKNNKRNEEVCGFTKRSHDNSWLYSFKTVDTLREYMEKCPELFDYMSVSEHVSSDQIHHTEMFPDGDGEEKLKALSDWIKELPCTTSGKQPCGTLTVDEPLVKAIEEALADSDAQRQPKKQITMQVKPHLIYKPNLTKGASMPDPDTTFELLDRVVNIRDGFSVPLGLRGTIIGLHKAIKPEESMVEVLFDSEFQGGLAIRSSQGRSYRLPGSAIINITHSERANRPRRDTRNTSKPTAVVPPLGSAAIGNGSQQRPTKPYPQQQQQQNLSYSGVMKRDHPVEQQQRPTAKMVAPPDPKHLPNPAAFFGQPPVVLHPNSGAVQAGRGRGRGNNKPTTRLQPQHHEQLHPHHHHGGMHHEQPQHWSTEHLWQQQEGQKQQNKKLHHAKQHLPPHDQPQHWSMEHLWQSMQSLPQEVDQSNPQPPPPQQQQQQEQHQHQQQQQQQQHQQQQQPLMDPAVQQFFAMHQMQEHNKPPPPFVPADVPVVMPHAQVVAPKGVVPPHEAPKGQHRQHQQGGGATAFVPLQVSMKRNKQHKKPPPPAIQPPKAEDHGERVQKWIEEAATNKKPVSAGAKQKAKVEQPKSQQQQQTHKTPTHTEGSKKEKTPRKNKLAANFGTADS